ncbi:hypothetical protein SCREM1_118 [Synechococcus phage S-CREM1]|nr:hypothetical protein SCREM1_118 [Synechococcus phage S-CREM1]
MVVHRTHMTQDEWNELNTLKNAITYDPASVHPAKMERFTELMVQSLEGKGDYTNRTSPTNY